MEKQFAHIMACLFYLSVLPPLAFSEVIKTNVVVADPWVDVRAYGAKGDGVTDDRAAIQSAIDATPYGGTLIIPGGPYLIKQNADSGYLLKVTKSIRIFGNSLIVGGIFVDASVDNVTDVFRVNPATGSTDTIEFNHLTVIQNRGTPGRDIIRIVSDKTHLNREFVVEGCTLKAMGRGYAVNYENNGNPIGPFHIQIRNSQLHGGIRGREWGDSNEISGNIISGNNIGIDVTMLGKTNPYGISSTFIIYNNNITNTGGAIKIVGGWNIFVKHNNIEQTTLLEHGTSVILRNVDTDTVAGGASYVSGNKISPTDPTSRANGLWVDNCHGTIIFSNYVGNSAILDRSFNVLDNTYAIRVSNSKFISLRDNRIYASKGTYGIIVDNTSRDTMIERNIIDSTWSPKNILDNGVGTIGIMKNADYTTGSGGFSDFSGEYPSASYIKGSDGIVHVFGTVKKSGGRIASNDNVFQFPEGFRPASISTCFSSYLNKVTQKEVAIGMRIVNTSGWAGQLSVTGAYENIIYINLNGCTFYAPLVP